MRILNKALLTLAFGGMTAVVAACPASLDDRCAGGACDPNASSSGDAATDGPIVDGNPPGCDPAKEQKDQEACLNNEFAVFVSTLGRPDATGTKEAPVNTVKRALELVGGTKQRIYVCEGTYDERVSLKVPVSLYGGFSCEGGTWKANNSRPVFGRKNEQGFALDVGAAGAFEIVDLEFDAAPGSATSKNSIGARVVSSPGLTLKRVTLAAAAGAEGASAGAAATGVRVPTDGKGIGGSTGAGGGPRACTCTIGGPTAGGQGGGPPNGGGLAGSGDVVGSGATDGAGGAGGSTNCMTGKGHDGGDAPTSCLQQPRPSGAQLRQTIGSLQRVRVGPTASRVKAAVAAVATALAEAAAAAAVAAVAREATLAEAGELALRSSPFGRRSRSWLLRSPRRPADAVGRGGSAGPVVRSASLVEAEPVVQAQTAVREGRAERGAPVGTVAEDQAG